jgi:hypothetical protein
VAPNGSDQWLVNCHGNGKLQRQRHGNNERRETRVINVGEGFKPSRPPIPLGGLRMPLTAGVRELPRPRPRQDNGKRQRQKTTTKAKRQQPQLKQQQRRKGEKAMEKALSAVPLDYKTIRVTKSRIDKGLLAIPISLADLFPQKRGQIVLIDEQGIRKQKSFSPCNSSTHECRIGGLRDFFDRFSIQDGDELVIQKFADNLFRVLPDKIFAKQLTSSLRKFESSRDEKTMNEALLEAVDIANTPAQKIIENEFVKLSNDPFMPRRLTKNIAGGAKRERVPCYLRNVLKTVYSGKCQISNFSFLGRNGEPYFEIHHIDPAKGNHIKNLLVVSPNVHAQFTHAKVEHMFDDDKWLRAVKFNDERFDVFEKIDCLQKTFAKEIHTP